jgi:AcrR family transcriptional regulator
MPSSPRRQPRQARALATRAAILEATAQIIEAEGEAAFNTNRVAERAGVSVGTLYQYFADKRAILVAISYEEMAAVRQRLARELADTPTDPVRLAIRAQIQILRDRPATRRAALRAILDVESAETIARETRATQKLLPRRPDAMEGFVLSRAVAWVIRAAVLEASPHLTAPGFEDALVRLVEGYAAR